MFRARIYKVVVVEDEPIILRSIVSKIERSNSAFRVVGTALNGADALAVIEQENPDLLITDIQMPWMNGLELIRRVRESHPDVLVVILSNYGDFSYAKEALSYGVKEYMIKTPSMEETVKVLAHMHRILEQRDYALLGHYISELIFHHKSDDLGHSVQEWAGEYRFRIYWIHFGNLTRRHTFPETLPFYHSHCSSDAVQKVLSESIPEEISWWLIDTPSFFGMYLFLEDSGEEGRYAEIETTLLTEAQKGCTPYPVNLYTTEASVGVKAFEEEMYRLVQYCEEHRCPWKSGIERVGAARETVGSLQLIDGMTVERFKTILASPDRKELHRRITELSRHWEYGAYTQRAIELHILYLLDLLRRQKTYIGDDELDHAEFFLLYKLCIGEGFPALAEELLSLLESGIFTGEDVRQYDISNVVEQIEKYLRENYTSPISINDIAARFYFTPSYLSRMFKKYTKVSPLKYMINLRIDETKRLIRDNSGLSFKEIGTLVGYPDQNYFSRIFKNATGQSLSEYAESVGAERQRL